MSKLKAVVGIDIRVLGNESRSGVEEYTENLLSYLLPLDKDIKFKLFFSSFKGKLKDYDWLRLNNVELHQFKIPNRILFFLSSIFNYPKVDKLIGGADIFFSPHFFITSLSDRCKRVTTFHDLSYIHYPEFLSWRRKFWHNFQMKPLWQSKFSDRIIAVSESTKNDLVNIYGNDPAKIDIIYSGISENIKRPSDQDLNKFKKDKGLPDKYILFLGKIEPRKNIIGLIKAFNIIKGRGEAYGDLNLVIIGSNGWLYHNIYKEINKSKFKNNIFLINKISDDDRKFYYSLAKIFVYPSFFEGFGFPPLEAMACGTPVITSANSSLPEVVVDNALLVKPENIDDIASSIINILTDSNLKNRLVNSSLEKINRFSWGETAQKTLVSIQGSIDKI